MKLPESIDEVVMCLMDGVDEPLSVGPVRMAQAHRLIRAGVDPEMVNAAVNRINASVWVGKPPAEVTDEEVAKLLADRPWEENHDE